MSCTTVRERLLASERPDRPSAVDARHLASCPGCRAWQCRLVRLEQSLPLVPVPPTAVPAGLLEKLERAAAGPTLIRLPDRWPPAAQRRREGGRQKLALAAALAAALLLFALGLWLWPQPGGPDHSRERREYQQRVASCLQRANKPAQRVVALGNLADDLLKEAIAHPLEPDRLARVARDFDRLMREDLPRHAGEIPADDREAVLMPVAAGLRRINSEALRLAAEWSRERVASARSLEEIAGSANAARERLRVLARVRA
jgi:hypothetical protein